MEGGEARVIAFVDLDDDQAGEESEDADRLEDVVDFGSKELVSWCWGGGWLEDERSLDLEEEGGGIQKLSLLITGREQCLSRRSGRIQSISYRVRREENQLIWEDAGPNEGDELRESDAILQITYSRCPSRYNIFIIFTENEVIWSLQSALQPEQ